MERYPMKIWISSETPLSRAEQNTGQNVQTIHKLDFLYYDEWFGFSRADLFQFDIFDGTKQELITSKLLQKWQEV